MSVCGLFPPCLLFLVIMATATTTSAAVLSILSPCNVSSQCPDNATCLHALNRTQCTCNEGFVASTSLAVCEKAVYLNQPCVTRCAGFFMVCESTLRRCLCTSGYSPAADGKNCVETGRGLLGEACGMGCAFNLEQVCVDGVCRCMPGNRSMTAEEIRIFNHRSGQCTNHANTSAQQKTTTTRTTTNERASKRLSQATESTILQTSLSPLAVTSPKPRSSLSIDNLSESDPHYSGMTVGLAAGISAALFLTLIAFVVVVVVVRRRKRLVERDNSGENGGGGTSSSSAEAGALPDVLAHSSEIHSSTPPHSNKSHVTDAQDKIDADDVGLPDGKLPSKQDHSVVYSNFKIKQNKAKQVAMTTPKAEESSPDDSTYNTLSVANLKSRDKGPDQTEDYNTLYNMET